MWLGFQGSILWGSPLPGQSLLPQRGPHHILKRKMFPREAQLDLQSNGDAKGVLSPWGNAVMGAARLQHTQWFGDVSSAQGEAFEF